MGSPSSGEGIRPPTFHPFSPHRPRPDQTRPEQSYRYRYRTLPYRTIPNPVQYLPRSPYSPDTS